MTDSLGHDLAPVKSREHDRVGAVLGQAFRDDPLWAAVMTDPDARSVKLSSMFSALSKATLAASGYIERTTGFEAVALWMPPGRDIGFWSMLRSGLALPRFVGTLPKDQRRRITSVLDQLEDQRERLMPEGHWYLSAIGVAPESQGRGFGSSLVRSGIERADVDGVPVYLETETERNVAYYERFGFSVADRVDAVGLDLPVWQLIRRPPSGRG